MVTKSIIKEKASLKAKKIMISYFTILTFIGIFIGYSNILVQAAEQAVVEEPKVNIMEIQPNYLDILLAENVKRVDYEISEGVFIKIKAKDAKELDEIKERNRIKKEQEELIRLKNTVSPKGEELVFSSVSSTTDLSVKKTITTDNMNTIIEYYNSICGGTPFLGRGEIFIEAAKQSGLDPIYIFAHASLESDYGKSEYGRSGNYFGIGAFDSNPDNAYTYGNDTMESGIINGSIWISSNYYQQGQSSLYEMIYGAKQYASSADKWIGSILSIMNTSYSMI